MRESQLAHEYPETEDLSPEMQQQLLLLLKEGFTHDEEESERLRERALLYRNLLIGAATLLALAVIAIFVMVPLKERVPQIVRVDMVNGLAEVIHTTGDRASWGNADEYWARRYVAEREQYIHGFRREQFRRVMAMSCGTAAQTYNQYFSAKNPQSPQLTYGAGILRKPTLRSYQRISEDTAIVRFSAVLDYGDDRKVEPSFWLATLHFKYSEPPADKELLEINPLGYQVCDYRVDPESLGGGL